VKYAITFRKHVGPIQQSLSLFAAANNIDVLVTNPKNMNAAPKGYSWDDYDGLIWFDNKPPTVETSAKVMWWMCDLRVPQAFVANTTSNYIAISNNMYISEYADYYGVPVVHVPPCGNDTAVKKGRNLGCDVLFIGHVGRPAEGKLETSSEMLRAQVLDKHFHWNRVPIMEHLREADMSVEVISREGATDDSKWLYQQAPISLSVSLPVNGYSSNRLYNILASRGFCLALWFPGIEDMFRNHEHLVWFKTYEEAVSLAKHYLGHPEERETIKEAGYQEYLVNHTAANRVNRMLEAMS
jgi:hypothetical protein